MECCNAIYCLLRGRIKDKNSAVSVVKWQVCCIDNTAWVSGKAGHGQDTDTNIIILS